MGFPAVIALFIFLLASVVVGAATILSTIINGISGKNSKRKTFLLSLIQELERKQSLDHRTDLEKLIHEYRKEIEELGGEVPEPSVEEAIEEHQPVEQRNVRHSDAHTTSQPMFDWNNWYSENSISLLLYIGALLIILTASILVGFSWQSMSGIAKALLLTGTTLAFLISGILFMRIPTVKHAGSTFTAVGTLLISFTGIGWYVFVMKDMGIAFGWVGAVSSIVTIIVSVLISYWVENPIYPYLTAVGMIACILSLLQVSDPPLEWYIFSSQLMSFVFLGMRKVYIGSSHRDIAYQNVAKQLSSLLMPVSLGVGLYLAAQNGTLFDLKPALLLLIASGYYAVSYVLYKVEFELNLAEILLPVGIIFLLHSLQYSDGLSLLAGTLIFTLWSVNGAVIMKTDKEKSRQLGVIGLFGSCITAVFASVVVHDTWLLPGISFVATVAGILCYIISDQELVLIPIALSMAVGTFQGIGILFAGTPQEPGYFLFALIAFGWYLFPKMFPLKREQGRQLTLVISAVFYLVSVFLLRDIPVDRIYLSMGAMVFAGLFLVFGEMGAVTLTTVSGVWFLWEVLGYFHADLSLYVILYAVLGLGLYAVTSIDRVRKQRWEIHAFVVLLSIPLLLPLLLSVDYVENPLVWYCIGSLGAASLFIAAIAFIQERRELLYKISVVGMFVVSWSFYLSGMREISVHSLLWGIYFLVLGMLKRNDGVRQDAEALDMLGIIVLVGPATMQSFSGKTGDAVILGATGIGLIAYGIFRSRKMFSLSGAAALFLAILSQTYQYILGLEQWMVTGILGIAFLAGAMTLLLRKSRK